MKRPKKPDTEDIELFRRSVGPVRRLTIDTVAPPRQRRSPRPRRQPVFETPAPVPGFSGEPDAGIGADDLLFFARPGVQQRQLQRLRRGQLPVEAELDMHGMTIPVAENETARFLTACRDRHCRCVRIIHGKGYGSKAAAPVLKNRVDHWLRQHHDVLAFCSTPRERGGTGAVNVLLRSARSGDKRRS